MGRLLKYLIMFGPMLYRMYKKFAAGRQNNQQVPRQQIPQNQPTRQKTSGNQSRDGQWEFNEGENPLG